MRVRLIDFEYASPNDIGYDIANHWLEYASDYHSGAAHELDYSRLPSASARDAFCRAYVGAAADALRRAIEANLPAPSLAVAVLECGLGGGGGAATGTSAASANSNPSATCSSSPASAPSTPSRLPHEAAILLAPSTRERAAKVLRAKAEAAMPLPELVWALWGLIQAKVSDVDFDYKAYADQKIAHWHALKGIALRTAYRVVRQRGEARLAAARAGKE